MPVTVHAWLEQEVRDLLGADIQYSNGIAFSY
jgi:hypothetical protein